MPRCSSAILSNTGRLTVKTIERNVGGVVLHGILHERLKDDEAFPRPCALILAGGAYEHRSRRETEPVMLRFLSSGYQVFTLDYTVGRENIALHEPEREVNAAINHIRENAAEYDTHSHRIVLVGFSAGGHLALSSQCHFASGRADALVLCYPVVTTGKYGHEVSTFNITGGDEKKKQYYSLENQITDKVPPTFIWHTTKDKSVHPMNTLLLSEALTEKHIPFEYHLFQKGKHGLSICTNDVNSPEERTSNWLPLVFSWLEDILGWKQ